MLQTCNNECSMSIQLIVSHSCTCTLICTYSTYTCIFTHAGHFRGLYTTQRHAYTHTHTHTHTQTYSLPVGLYVVRSPKQLYFSGSWRKSLNHPVDLIRFMTGGAYL